MESNKQKNYSAFPINEETTIGQMGLTMRDYFAAKAMQSMLNDIAWKTRAGMTYQEDISNNAYMIADAMLKQREL